MIKNKAIRFGDNVDTDQIIPAKHLCHIDVKDMAKFAFEFDENFMRYFTSGSILVGGSNFGCGSSREQAPAVLKQRGVSAIIAEDFARIFFRNCINIGIPLIECKDAGRIDNLDILEIDTGNGMIKNITKKEEYRFKPFPKYIQDVVAAGGIIMYNRKKSESV